MTNPFKPLAGLFHDANGEISHTKFWNNIACAAATYLILKKPDVSVEFFQWYLGLVGFQALASKAFTLWLNNKTGQSASSTFTTTTTTKESEKTSNTENTKEA